jgi:hypothetical protein
VESSIEVVGGSTGHRSVPFPSSNDRLVPGEVVQVRFTAAERHIAPHTHYVYFVGVKAPRGASIPILVDLDGGPSGEPHCRAEVKIRLRTVLIS